MKRGKSLNERVEFAIQHSRPKTGRRGWQRGLFEFLRHLKGFPEFTSLDPAELDAHLSHQLWQWKNAYLPATVSIGRVRNEALRCWNNIESPVGVPFKDRILVKAKDQTPVKEITRYKIPELNLIASVCMALQENIGSGKPFHLSTRTLSGMLSKHGYTRTPMSCWRDLQLLQKWGFLHETMKGKKTYSPAGDIASKYVWEHIPRLIDDPKFAKVKNPRIRLRERVERAIEGKQRRDQPLPVPVTRKRGESAEAFKKRRSGTKSDLQRARMAEQLNDLLRMWKSRKAERELAKEVLSQSLQEL
jgi:hypothetical protein